MQHDPLDDDVYKNAHLLGIDPHLPFYDLNLAGSQGVPDPQHHRPSHHASID